VNAIREALRTWRIQRKLERLFAHPPVWAPGFTTWDATPDLDLATWEWPR
jgi:hypothetical protein